MSSADRSQPGSVGVSIPLTNRLTGPTAAPAATREGGFRNPSPSFQWGASSSAQLGANCLPSFFQEGRSAVEAHEMALDCLAAAGFQTTEISYPELLDQADAPSLRRHAAAIGLTFRAVHAPPMRRDPALARQREAALLAAELGAAILVVHVSSLRFASPVPAIREAARERDLRRLEHLLAFCAPLGLALGLENGRHPAHADYLLTLLEALEGCPGFEPNPAPTCASAPIGLVFDAGHAALRGGDPLAVARAMLPRLLHTHLHDNNGAQDEHRPPGAGRIDWPALLALLKDSGYAGALLLELRARRAESVEQWEQELAFGRAVITRTG